MNYALCILLTLLLTISPARADFEDDLSATGGEMRELRDLRVRAGNGDADAQLAIGAVFFKGRDIEQDYAEAAKWFRLAADQGIAQAQYNLGMLYATGRGVAQDLAAAAAWYRKAAEQQLAIAELNYGVACSYGEGVPKDEAEALRWFRLAAEHGEAVAQFDLAVMYANGQGVPQDLDESQRLARLSAANGYQIANALADDLARRKKPDRSPGVYLQLGAFRTHAQAQDFVEKTRTRMADDVTPELYEQDGWIRIQIGPYSDREEAQRSALALKSRLGYEPKIKQR